MLSRGYRQVWHRFLCLSLKEHHKSYTLIKSLPEPVWAHTSYHPENGETSLDDWLDTYERHVPEHIEYMRENLRAWKMKALV